MPMEFLVGVKNCCSIVSQIRVFALSGKKDPFMESGEPTRMTEEEQDRLMRDILILLCLS